MADVIRKATNRFTKGLVMDFSPENTKNELLTNALNATLLTFNGNELSLLNDMGNGRVETAYLPDGYMPVGTCEYGGIIYIVSYNPLEDKSLIGCFPSPERNISSDELGLENKYIDKTAFQQYNKGVLTGDIKHNTQYVLLKNDNLNPGDKFIVCSEKSIYNEKLADLYIDKDSSGKGFKPISNPIIALNVVSIEDSGKIIYLNSDIKQYEVTNSYNVEGEPHTDTYKYHILGKMIEGTSLVSKDDLDNYRDVLSSGYSVFKSKTSGRLAILAELIMIDSYSVTHSIEPRVEDGQIIEGMFDIILHTEVSPEININNYNLVPKLHYYYLLNSLGYLLIEGNLTDNTTITLFNIKEENGKKVVQVNDNFYNTKLSQIYEPIDSSINLKSTLGESGKFNFPKPFTYHSRLDVYNGDVSGTTDKAVYTKFTEGKYHRIDKSQIKGKESYFTDTVKAKFYYYNPEGEEFVKYENKEIDLSYTYYIRKDDHIYHDAKRSEEHKNKILYKLITSPIAASEKEVKDKTIEKFLYQEIHIYHKATPEDLKNSDKLFYIDEELKYVLLTGSPKDGVLYYTLESDRNLVSIGYEIKDNVVQGTIYYYPSIKTYEIASQEERDKYYDFITYPPTEKEPYGSPITLYWKLDNYKYIEATENQIVNREELNIHLFYSTNYLLISRIDLLDSMTYQIFIVVPIDTFIGKEYFEPNPSYNYFNGKKPNDIIYPKDDELLLFTISNFIPNNIGENVNFDELSEEEKKKYFNYQDVKLANIKLPSVVSVNGLDLPFKYDYTIVPCMNYGRLDHLAVSNTVDFSKLHAFNLSDFHTWKYYIEDNLLRLTFGANIYDTYEENKVDALVLEFYDCWGFAGSLEIVDKKSYSGIFTKIISLNSIKALSLKKIIGNEYTTNFARNINIKEVYDKDGNLTDEFIYSGKSVEYNKDNPTIGWRQKDGVKPEEDVIVLNNDCGTLYSNLLYGVKAYLRIRLKDGGKKFIKKKEFFLYTLPIYNDYYYIIDDFSNLENPELDLMLTYKIKDTSNRIDYNEGNIINGYNPLDKENVDKYLDGFSDKRQFDLVKYYKYVGTSELYLEIGLKKDYESLNISYNPNINLYFNGKLKLLSDDNSNETFTVNSGVDGISNISQILNYRRGDTIIEPSINKLKFNGQNTELPIGGTDFKETNFINYIGTKPVKIEYEFVVGYTATINEIRTTLVQATTICALFHKKPSGEYNYEDFGVYELITTKDGEEIKQLLSSAIFYNAGNKENEVLGICRLINTFGTNMEEQLDSYDSVTIDAQEIQILGKLNSGEPLKLLIGNIGKLTFCQPHAHGFSNTSGVNIHGGSGAPYGITPDVSIKAISDMDRETSHGIIPRNYLYNNPKYNLCVNTKNSINYNSEFISTLEYEEKSGKILMCNTNDYNDDGKSQWAGPVNMREFIGLTGSLLEIFNTKMLKTMESVYVYNPDYDSLTVNVGAITLQNYNPYFTSNLLNTLSNLVFQNNLTLNDFIYLGPIIFTNYLKYLNNNSKSNDGDTINIYKKDDPKAVLSQIQLVPNFDYCGTPENWYLISPLTYNTPVPKDLEYELEFSASDIIVIKHTDGHNTFLEGTPNKKTLYGYNSEFNKMILLDVSNYTIDSDGVLKLNNDGSRKLISSEVEITTDMHLDIVRGNCYYSTNLKTENGDVPVTINIKLRMQGMDVLYEQLTMNLEYILIGLEQPIPYQNGFSIKPEVSISSSNDKYTYSIKPTEIELECEYKTLNEKTVLFDSNLVYDSDTILLRAQSYETLMDLVSSTVKTTNFVNILGSPILNRENNYYWSSPSSYDMNLFINNIIVNNLVNNLLLSQNGDLQFKLESRVGVQNRNYTLGILKLKLKKLKFEITQVSKLETTPESFIHTTRTNKYSDFENSKYVIYSDYNNARLKGSSITLNDLIYEPNAEGHRLYMRNNLWIYNSALRGKLYYRDLDETNNDVVATWNYEDTKYYNNIFLFTGPCFTPDTLNT